MKQGLLSWSPCPHPNLFSTPSLKPKFSNLKFSKITSLLANESPLTARERRQMRNERRESKPVYDWKDDVETKLIKKTKKRYASWTEELNLDNLALLGPQWWGVRVARVSGQETAERVARLLARNYPDIEFKLYMPYQKKIKEWHSQLNPNHSFLDACF